jgi:hypothetical protein
MQLQRRVRVVAAAVMAIAAIGLADVWAQSIPMEHITGEDGRYSVDMPRGHTSKTSPRPDGGTMHQRSFMWKDSVGQFNAIALAVIDPPPGSTKHFDMEEIRRQMTARYPGSFLSRSQEIQSGPAKGLSFAMTVNSNRGQGVHVIAFKVYALGGRLYEMMAETRIEDRDDPTVAAFMNSLRVLR